MSLATTLYLGGCLALHICVYLLFRRAGLQKEFGNFMLQVWGGIERFVIALLFWPVSIVIGLFVLWHHISERNRMAKRARERAEAQEKQGKYAGMSLDALIREQRRVLRPAVGDEK
jgi:hypothetical protein